MCNRMKNEEGGRGERRRGKQYTQTLWENRVLHAFRMSKLNNFTNSGASDLIFVSFYTFS